MSQAYQRQSNGARNLSQILASEARLTRLHRLFKTHFDVTEPSVILEPYLFLGNCISAHDTHRLSALGIRYILNVAIRDVELCPYYSEDMRILTIDLRDDDRENILRTFDQAFAFIDEAKRNKSRVLVHCSHGQSRSPAIVLAYLMRTYHVSLEQCLVHVVKARPCVLPNDGFLKQLILYDRFLVERRRRQQEENLKKVANDTPPLQPTDETNTPPVDSSKIQSPVNVDPIHVIPIQVPLKTLHTEKIETIPIKKIPVEEIKIPHKRSKENIAAKASSKSSHSSASKKRQSALINTIVKPSPSQTPRSHSAHTARTQTNNYGASSQQWNVTTYYPLDYHAPNDEKPTKYITEIYDKATNRFIPTNCS